MIHATDNDRLREMLDSYLLGRLSPEEEKMFSEKLLSDAELRDETAMMQRILEAISSHACRREAMMEWDKEEAGKSPQAVRASLGSRLRPVLSAAASVALICTLGLYIYSTSAGPSAGPIPSDVPEARGSAGDGSVSEIVSSLNKGRQIAIETLDMIDTALKDSLPDAGIRPEEEAYQRELIAGRMYELKWMRINTLVSLGRIDEVKEELKVYASQPGSNREKAGELLRSLEI